MIFSDDRKIRAKKTCKTRAIWASCVWKWRKQTAVDRIICSVISRCKSLPRSIRNHDSKNCVCQRINFMWNLKKGSQRNENLSAYGKTFAGVELLSNMAKNWYIHEPQRSRCEWSSPELYMCTVSLWGVHKNAIREQKNYKKYASLENLKNNDGLFTENALKTVVIP